MAITVSDLDLSKYSLNNLGIIAKDPDGLTLYLSLRRGELKLTLRSEVQTKGINRRTLRKTFWTSDDPPLDRLGLLRLKTQAIEFYEATKSVNDDRRLSDFIEPFLKSYQDSGKAQSTIASYRCALNYFTSWLDRSLNITSHELAGIDRLLSGRKDMTPYAKAYKQQVMIMFLRYVARFTGNGNLGVEIEKYRTIKTNFSYTTQHRQTIESHDNNDLQNKITLSFLNLFLHLAHYPLEKSDPRFLYYPFFVLKHFLIPCRITEVCSITAEDVTAEKVHIKKTKTLKNGFDVPIIPTIEELLRKLLSLGEGFHRKTIRDFFKLAQLNLSPHGVRSVFADYMTRKEVPFYVVEGCLSHVLKGSVATAYHRDASNFFYAQRRKFMPVWYGFIFTCFLDALEAFNKQWNDSDKSDAAIRRYSRVPWAEFKDLAYRGQQEALKASN